MNTKCFVFTFLVFVSFVSSLNIPGDNSICESQVKMSEACKQNTRFVTLRRMKPDYSVAFSQYMALSNLSFEKYYTMNDLNYNGESPEPEEIEMPEKTSFSHAEDIYLSNAFTSPLEVTALSENPSKEENYYVIYAAIDLMNYAYRFQDKGKGNYPWKFSAQQLIDEKREVHTTLEGIEMADYNNIREIMDHLATKGVCKEDSYITYDGGCERYKIDGYEYLWQNATNQWILNNLMEQPLYVQLGLHPLYYQFYTPKCEEPIHAGYIKPNLAGVLTGYNFDKEGEEYWEVYIRRHNSENKVNVACMFEKEGLLQPPAAGIASKIYRIEKDSDLSPVKRTKFTLSSNNNQKVSTQQEFEQLYKKIMDDANVNEEEVILDSSLFNCGEEEINVNHLFNNTKKIVIVGENDFSCLNMDELEIDYVELDEEELEGGLGEGSLSGRRLSPTTPEPKKYDNKKFLSITIGKNKYQQQSLYIRNCPMLTRISIGENSFKDGSEFILDNNPLLNSVSINSNVFGSGLIEDSSVLLKDLPLLEYVVMDKGAFDNIATVRTANVHPINDIDITFIGDDAFRNLKYYYPEGNNHPMIVDYFTIKSNVTPSPTESPSAEPSE